MDDDCCPQSLKRQNEFGWEWPELLNVDYKHDTVIYIACEGILIDGLTFGGADRSRIQLRHAQ